MKKQTVLSYRKVLLDPENLQLHCFVGLGALSCCSFFCPLDQSCKTLQMVQAAPLPCVQNTISGPQERCGPNTPYQIFPGSVTYPGGFFIIYLFFFYITESIKFNCQLRNIPKYLFALVVQNV